MKVTFTLYRTPNNRFRVFIFKEDSRNFYVKHMATTYTLDEALWIARHREDYRGLLDDGYESDDEREDIWRSLLRDVELLEFYVNTDNQIACNLYQSRVDPDELTKLIEFIEKELPQ
jgi:hypothetical protein